MGERVRHRPCIHPSNGGYPCPADVDSELEACEMAPCPGKEFDYTMNIIPRYNSQLKHKKF